MSSKHLSRSRAAVLVLALAVVAAGAAAWYLLGRPRVPQQGSPEYEAVSRAFYGGLAALDVGLLDNARQAFTDATQIVPDEPASWANLGLTLLRLGELDAAADPIGRAVALAPQNAELALLAGRMEISRGRVDAGIEQLQRAVALDPRGLRPRFAVAEEIERGELTDESRRRAEALYDELLTLAPDNLVILIERARLAAADNVADAIDTVRRLRPLAAMWPAEAIEQLDAVEQALQRSDGTESVRALTRLRNVLARVPAYRESLAAVRTPPELFAEPVTQFLVLESPSPVPDAPDTAMTFTAEDAGVDGDALGAVTVAALNGEAPPAIIPRAATAIDWNRDFRTDVVEADASGLRLFEQDATGAMADVTARAAAGAPFVCECAGAWPADIEMDGDLDLVVARVSGATVVLRNNGDGTWQQQSTLATVDSARAFSWADVDGDADPDAVFVNASGQVIVLLNRQAAQFAAVAPPAYSHPVVAVAVADVDANGALDVVTFDANGGIAAVTYRDGQWDRRDLAAWSSPAGDMQPGLARLLVSDLDNNGALDLIASTSAESRVWLGDERLQFSPLNAVVPAPVFGVADFDGDGRLDLAGVSNGRAVRFRNRGDRAYHWKSIRARAQPTAGDQRINSFGIGGDIQVRSGLLVQKQLLTGLPAHFGLGSRTTIDVARIVWPNGVPQAEFDVSVDDGIVAEQRLKGSCPWVFAWDGERMAFVTDFLWRSPLGLRINAQDTAGTTQTEDWVRIRGDQMRPRAGVYDVRITAELWETHYFDHVSLLTVDHPAGTEVFVDERFSPVSPQEKTLHAVRNLAAVSNAIDESARDVTAIVGALDGRYLATFALGEYQGISSEHFVAFDVPRAAAGERQVLIAQGWVYPTDSSINVAIGQRQREQPRGLALEAQDASGAWRTIAPDLGFPAGKNKTMVIPLSGTGGATRLRLRTNLEVYWDALRVGARADVPMRTHRVELSAADLRYRGFSVTASPRGDSPETPDYARLANVTARWRDLEGYYTRFGDVLPLLAAVDDRYVIMNAGDEMRLQFPAVPPPADGWPRDFVLIGDGWEKDGDYNTGYSTTVTPLPTHARSEYAAASESLRLEDDPVYRKHPADWETFHTRYVTADRFLEGLR